MNSLMMAVKHATSLIIGFSAIFSELYTFLFVPSINEESFLTYVGADPLPPYFL